MSESPPTPPTRPPPPPPPTHPVDAEVSPVQQLSRDLKKAAKTMSLTEIRYLVDGYYMLQEYRKAAGNQVRALEETKEPHEILTWLYQQSDKLEAQIKRALDSWTDDRLLGQWLKSITGIGPVIASGLMANIDVKIAVTASHLYSYCGYDPTTKWEKGQKRPWNADLKRLCFIIGDSFIKQSGRENSHYGHLYFERKEIEQKHNEAGHFAEQAKRILTEKNFRRDTEAKKWYGDGKLPPGHIHMRAQRWMTKIFLDHYVQVGRAVEGLSVPVPYPIAHLEGHVHRMPIPNWPMGEKEVKPKRSRSRKAAG